MKRSDFFRSIFAGVALFPLLGNSQPQLLSTEICQPDCIVKCRAVNRHFDYGYTLISIEKVLVGVRVDILSANLPLDFILKELSKGKELLFSVSDDSGWNHSFYGIISQVDSTSGSPEYNDLQIVVTKKIEWTE